MIHGVLSAIVLVVACAPGPRTASSGSDAPANQKAEPGSRHVRENTITIPELYPDLARLLAEYFSLEQARNGARYQDAVLVFVLTESHEVLLQTKSDAKSILSSESELRAFESYLGETGLKFSELGAGVTAADWLTDVMSLISSSV